MAKYLACGNTIYDSVQSIDGTETGEHLGGQAIYATSGIRLWNPSVKMVTGCGADYKEGYAPWLKANGLTEDGINVKMDYCSHVHMQHTESGAYKTTSNPNGLGYNNYFQGFLETTPDDIERAIDPDTVAFYHHTLLPDYVLFNKIAKIREKYGVKYMWEIMFGPGGGQFGYGSPYFNHDKLQNAIEIAGMWSLNRNEAADMFKIPSTDDDAIINELMKFRGSEMCYYRCGSKGAYTIVGNSAYFVPLIDITESVDPMGCGNCSTGTAMYAWCETGDPLMTGIMAAISSGYNAAQAGPWPLYTEEDTRNAEKLAKEWYDKLKVNYPELNK